jgi:hypothetical protein
MEPDERPPQGSHDNDWVAVNSDEDYEMIDESEAKCWCGAEDGNLCRRKGYHVWWFQNKAYLEAEAAKEADQKQSNENSHQAQCEEEGKDGNKAVGDKLPGDKSSGQKPSNDRPSSPESAADKPSGDKVFGGEPTYNQPKSRVNNSKGAKNQPAQSRQVVPPKAHKVGPFGVLATLTDILDPTRNEARDTSNRY